MHTCIDVAVLMVKVRATTVAKNSRPEPSEFFVPLTFLHSVEEAFVIRIINK